MLNGAIGGLVAVTAEPLGPSPFSAIFYWGCWWIDRSIWEINYYSVF
ncbi:MAG: hypothetical protein CM15mP34_2290 [Gammaproteobacteria bacterium]|nr:MAG: hypothetical protein CM15mP34_2290 [Gammaproteobacteria bacterium]